MKNEKSGSRLKEITAVLRKHELTRGITPEKLRLILEDLGPTFIKIGQIMSLHSDVLPKKYCDELMKLRSDVAPMPFSEGTLPHNSPARLPLHRLYISCRHAPVLCCLRLERK